MSHFSCDSSSLVGFCCFFFLLLLRSSRLQTFIWNGPISQNVSLRVISDVAKFHAFIIKLNNSVFFGR